MNYRLKINGKMYSELRSHLFPGDGNEAIAIAICGRNSSRDQKELLVHEVFLIPYEDCEIRKPNLVKWSTRKIIPFIEKAVKKGLGILKIHSHPTGYPEFSKVDDKSDKDLFDGVYGWMDNHEPHASAIMLPDGKMFGRVVTPELAFLEIERITVIGDDLSFWNYGNKNYKLPEFSLRTIQTFGEGTTNILRNLKIGIIGCSGTGSPVIEQLIRLGVGKILLVDNDIVERKNLNRILNSRMQDAELRRKKVVALKEAIERIGLGTEVTYLDNNLYDNISVVKEVSSCDVLFGCMDSVDGRHLLNQIATFYLIPYFDLGVKIIADGLGSIESICGAIHYLQPGGSSLRTREVYNEEKLRAAIQYRINPEEYHQRKKTGYLASMEVESPAVISINMLIASLSVNEMLSRLHPFRYDKNEEFAITRVDISDWRIHKEKDGLPDKLLQKFVGRGDCTPLLNMPELSFTDENMSSNTVTQN